MENFTFAPLQNGTQPYRPTFISNLAVSIVIGLLFLVGVIGSSLTMIVIRLNSSLHTKANYFIFSLCVSDLISALVCSPLWLYRRTWGFDRWQWGEFLCQFYWVSDFATNYVTSLHIMSFALLRFIAVKRPFKFTIISKKFVFYYLIALWIVSSCIAIPLFFIMGVEFDRANVQYGSNNWPSCSIKVTGSECCVQQYNTYFSVLNPIMFYIPDIAIITLSLLIVHQLVRSGRWRRRHSSAFTRDRKSKKLDSQKMTSTQDFTDDTSRNVESAVTKSSEDWNKIATTKNIVTLENNDDEVFPPKSMPTATNGDVIEKLNHVIDEKAKRKSQHDRNTFTQLSLIVISFMIGYVPSTLYLVWSGLTSDHLKGYGVDYWFGVIPYIFLRLSECINPIMYSLGSVPIRNKIAELLRKVFRCK